jgi:hypothetical protein
MRRIIMPRGASIAKRAVSSPKNKYFLRFKLA